MDPDDGFPPGFFDRADDQPDTTFYAAPRYVSHIDAGAVAAVGALYTELGVGGPARPRVLDLMSSWVSHLPSRPAHLTVLGLNAAELAANPMADDRVVHDLNTEPRLPLPDAAFDAVVCCASVDYLTRPVQVLAEVARVLAPGGVCVLTFSNRCFPTKAVRGWLATPDDEHGALVALMLRQAGFVEPTVARRTPARGYRGDPLWGVWAQPGAEPCTG